MYVIEFMYENGHSVYRHHHGTMNIYSALRSKTPVERAMMIGRVRNYIQDDNFVNILSSMDINNPASIRTYCNYLSAWDKDSVIRPKVVAWLRSTWFIHRTWTMECPICYEEMTNQATQLKCGHRFHKQCIEKWAEQQCTCPYCRYIFKNTPPPDVPMFLMMFTVIAYTYLFLIVVLSKWKRKLVIEHQCFYHGLQYMYGGYSAQHKHLNYWMWTFLPLSVFVSLEP